jgi:hypothetical protein
MNAQRRNRRTFGPIITLVCAGILAFIGLASTGANAEGVPTPSETTVATADVLPALAVDEPAEPALTAPTGTTMPVEP